MPKQNATRYAVLGLLNRKPSSGYDVKQAVEDEISHFWTESYRWIYTTLRDLAGDGLATARTEAGDGARQRTVYRITKRGQRALTDWLAEPVEPARDRDELLLKLFFGPMASARTSAEHVKRHQEAMLARHRQLAEYERELPSMGLDAESRRYVNLTLRLARRVTSSHLRWCEETLGALKSTPRRGKSKTGTKRRRAKAR